MSSVSSAGRGSSLDALRLENLPAAAEIGANEPAVNRVPLAPRDAAQAARTDLAVFNAMLKGDVRLEDGFRRVALSGGWPIKTAQGFIVAFAAKPGTHDVALAYEGNDWKKLPLERRGDLYFLHVAKEPRAEKYKLVVDGNYQPDPSARSYGYDDHGEYSLTSRPRAPHLEKYPLLTDGKVEARDVHVWVPAKKPTHQLYVHDGQNVFDPSAPHGGWRLQHTAGSHTLVIGIEHRDRFLDYTHTTDRHDGYEKGGGANHYADFIHLYLRPFIESRFGEAKKVGVLGSSLGGLASFSFDRRHPGYDFIGSLSGTFGWGKMNLDHETIGDRFQGVAPAKTVYYLDSGGGPGKDNYDSNMRMVATMEAAGHQHHRTLFHWHEPDAPHSEKAWADRAFRPFRIFEELR